MGLFEDILTRSHNRYLQQEQKRDSLYRASRASGPITDELRTDTKQTTRTDNAVDSMLGNPSSVDNVASALAVRFTPTTAKPKYAKYGSKVEAVDATVPNDHPMAGIGTKIRDAYEARLRASYGTGASQADLQSAAVGDVVTPEVVAKSYEYKAKADSSIKNYFGLFGESNVKALPGYEEWKQSVTANKAAAVDKAHKNHDLLNFGLVAGLDAAITVGGAAAAGTVATLSAPVVVGGALVAGALAVPAGRLAGYLSNKFRKSDFGTFHEDDMQGRVVGAGIGAAAMAAGGKGTALRSALGAAGGAIGAVDPALGVDLLGWTGAEAAMRHGGELAFSKMLQAGKINESAFEALKSNASAAKVINKFNAEKAEKAASEAVTTERLRAATEKALYETEFARMEKVESLVGILQKRKIAGMPNETGATVAKELRDIDGDAVSLANDLQLERRLATPGGPNSYASKSIAVPVAKGKKGKGKTGSAVQAATLDETALEVAHFNAFLEEMKSTNGAEWAASVERMVQGQKERKVFAKLFNASERPTSLADGLSELSWDGLNKVIGEGAEAGWKTLSIGNRIEIVKGAENAAHAAMVRSLGTVPGAGRLEALKKPLTKALSDGMKETPDALVAKLQAVVEGPKSPYVKDGALDLQTLQVDLADHGFESVQQLAFSLMKDKPKVSAKKLKAFEEATTAIRNGYGSNLVKLGVGGVAFAGAYGLANPDDSEAGVITNLGKVLAEGNGKVWGNFMQQVDRKSADVMISKSGVTSPQSMFKAAVGEHLYGSKPLRDVLAMLPKEQHEAFTTYVNNIRPKLLDSNANLLVAGAKSFDTYADQSVSISEIRNYLVSNHEKSSGGIINWADEKQMLSNMGIDSDVLIMTHGTKGEHTAPTYLNSADDNLYGPGVYTTSGVIRDGVEDITKGYAFSRSGVVTSKNPNTRQLVVRPSNVFDIDSNMSTKAWVNKFPELDGVLEPHTRYTGGSIYNILSTPKRNGYDFLSLAHDNAVNTAAENARSLAANRLKEVIISLPDSLEKNQFAQQLSSVENVKPTHLPDSIDSVISQLMNSGYESKAKELTKVRSDLMALRDAGRKRLVNDYLKSKGYDSITHVGGADKEGHRVMIMLDDSRVAPFLPVQDALSKIYGMSSTFKGATGASAAVAAAMAVVGNNDTTPDEDVLVGKIVGNSVLVLAESIGKKLDPLVSLLGPAEADAAGFDAAAKLVKNLKVSQAAAIAAKDAGDGITAMKYAYDAGLVFQELPAGATSARGLRAGYIDTAPKGAAEMQHVIRRLTAATPGQGLTTPYFSSQTLLKTVNDGDRLLGNPAIQLAHGQSVMSHNTRMSFEALDNIYANNGIKLAKENSAAIEKTMLPVQKKYEGIITEIGAQETAATHLRKEIEYFEKESLASKEFAANISPVIKVKKATLAAVEANIADLRPAYNAVTEELEVAHRALASQFPEARLSLAIEDTTDLAARPWLKGMLTPGEKQAVLQVQDLLAEYKERIINVMGKDAAIAGGYIKHSRAVTQEQLDRLTSLEERLSKLGLDGKEIIALTKLQSRTKYSQQMIPDVGRNMADYVPDVEKRLMNADFWNKWKPFVDSSTVKNSPALKGMFDRIAESAKPAEDTMLRRWSTNYAKFETIRLLTGLASAPAKHLFKVLGDVSQLGLLNTAAVMKDAGGMGLRNFVRIQGGKLAKAGFIDKRTADALFSKTKSTDSFVAALINQRGMLDYLSDIEKTYGVGHRSTVDKILDPLTDVAGAGIKVIETFDRTVSVLAAARMAQKAGMTGQQAMYGIYDTILKNNFLSGQLNSAWAKDPNVRALFLFQNTPFKIWERRISNAIIAGGDLKTAMGVIKKQELPAALAELQGMRKWVAQAAKAFKSGMIQDALTSSKDVFGNSVSGQFMREALGVGVVLGGGAMLGVDLKGHMLHTPFVNAEHSGAPEVSMSPITKAALYASTGKRPAGFEDWDADEDHFKVVDFFRHWHGTAGFSLMASKFGRISREDIPEQYKDSKFKFLFAMPAVEEE